ncbi:MAG: PIN/TRAM domain-containing protein, partial [Syntrophomonadaceae bacterium]
RLNICKRRFLFVLIIGIWIAYLCQKILLLKPTICLLLGFVAGTLCYLGLTLLMGLIHKALVRMNRMVDELPPEILMGSIIGLFMGILVGVLTTFPLSIFNGIGNLITIGIFCLSSFLGVTVGARRGPDLIKLISFYKTSQDSSISSIYPKVLDTSAIIDGRIYDVCLSNFLEGQLIVPKFVIEELQHIADSPDNIRRNKGRRGLELLSKMQKHSDIKIDIIEANITEEKDVDSKLLRLCKQINAAIITNDYNLNKVAELQGIMVLNINELTNAVKVIVYPGETMRTTIIKEGKEAGQGVGYLEDGTMVVVEDAGHEIGNDLDVIVTSVFQTAAGRMIFTRKVREEGQSSVNNVFKGVQEVNLYG